MNQVWMAAREYGTIAGTGGVKDVLRSLSRALVKKGLSVKVFLPAYGFMDTDKLEAGDPGITLSVTMDYAHEERTEEVSFYTLEDEGVSILLVKSPRFSEKLGVYTYTEEEERMAPWKKKGEGHFDFFATNVLLQKALLAYGAYTLDLPSCIHCHDGHTALIPPMMKELEGYRHLYRNTRAVVTIHNAGVGYHQDVADLPFARAITGLPWRIIHSSLLGGSFDPFLAAAPYSTLNTVSENYARELQETELDKLTGWLGHALKDRGIRLLGITNGIDPDAYDPRRAHALGLPMSFDPEQGDFQGKRAAKRLLTHLINSRSIHGLKCFGGISGEDGRPLLTSIGRLTTQKGMDHLGDALLILAKRGIPFDCVILGTGEKPIEERLKSITSHPMLANRVALILGYSERLGNLIYAAGDFFMIPSLYEPCGLTDFIAQLNGNLPVVRATGGLVKVRDGETGLSYEEHTPHALAHAIERGLNLYFQDIEKLHFMIRRAIEVIRSEYTWDKVAEKYIEIYRL